MIIQNIRSLLVAVCLCSAPAVVMAATLDEILVAAQREGDAAQAAQLKQAVSASPQLRERLSGLVGSGDLTAIHIVEDANAPEIMGHRFAGGTVDTTMLLTRGLLDELRDNRRSDVITEGEVLPDNTVFVLTHLATHLQARRASEAYMLKFKQEMREGMDAASKQGKQFDATAMAQRSIAHNMSIEAQAYIFAWNAVVDAAIQQAGKSRQLGEADKAVLQGPLLLNLRYGGPLIKAMELAEEERVRMGADRIEANTHNISAIAQGLIANGMLDIQ